MDSLVYDLTKALQHSIHKKKKKIKTITRNTNKNYKNNSQLLTNNLDANYNKDVRQLLH